MKQGYTKRVLQRQIGNYERALSYKQDSGLKRWLSDDFGGVKNCPICLYRFNRTFACDNDGRVEDCLATVRGKTCAEQSWYRDLTDMRGFLNSCNFNAKRIRKLVSKRLKFWKRIYAGRYPVKK